MRAMRLFALIAFVISVIVVQSPGTYGQHLRDHSSNEAVGKQFGNEYGSVQHQRGCGAGSQPSG